MWLMERGIVINDREEGVEVVMLEGGDVVVMVEGRGCGGNDGGEGVWWQHLRYSK